MPKPIPARARRMATTTIQRRDGAYSSRSSSAPQKGQRSVCVEAVFPHSHSRTCITLHFGQLLSSNSSVSLQL